MLKKAFTGLLKQKLKSNHCQTCQKHIFQLFRKKEIWNFNDNNWNCFDEWHNRKDMEFFKEKE